MEPMASSTFSLVIPLARTVSTSFFLNPLCRYVSSVGLISWLQDSKVRSIFTKEPAGLYVFITDNYFSNKKPLLFTAAFSFLLKKNHNFISVIIALILLSSSLLTWSKSAADFSASFTLK